MSRITFGGLASGLDTNYLIEQLIKLERQPIERKEKRILELEAVRDAWRDLNMRLRNLRSRLGDLLLPETFLSLTSQSSDPSLVSASVKPQAKPGLYRVEVSQLAAQHTVAMKEDIATTLGKGEKEAMGLQGKFKLKDLTSTGGEETGYVVVEVNSSDTLTTLRDKINSAKAGVEAFIVGGYLVLKSSVRGEKGALELAYVEGDDVLDILGIYSEEAGFYRETLPPQDALFSIDGLPFQRPTNEIKDIIPGVIFYLQGETGKDQSVYIQVTNDVQRTLEAVRAFVEQYNSVHDFIRNQLDEKGKLKGDTTLMKVQRQLRTLVSSPIQGGQEKKYSSLSSLGVATLDREGTLKFDEHKLISALNDDPQAVYEVFRFELEDEEGRKTGNFSGVGMELENYLKRLLTNDLDEKGRVIRAIVTQQEAALQRRIDELRRRIEIREERLLRYEERLIREFTALEKFIATMRSQSDELSRMIDQLVGFGYQAGRRGQG